MGCLHACLLTYPTYQSHSEFKPRFTSTPNRETQVDGGTGTPGTTEPPPDHLSMLASLSQTQKPDEIFCTRIGVSMLRATDWTGLDRRIV